MDFHYDLVSDEGIGMSRIEDIPGSARATGDLQLARPKVFLKSEVEKKPDAYGTCEPDVLIRKMAANNLPQQDIDDRVSAESLLSQITKKTDYFYLHVVRKFVKFSRDQVQEPRDRCLK